MSTQDVSERKRRAAAVIAVMMAVSVFAGLPLTESRQSLTRPAKQAQVHGKLAVCQVRSGNQLF